MSRWPSTKARRVLAALEKNGWIIKRMSGSRRTLMKPGFPDFVFAFHDNEDERRKVKGERRKEHKYTLFMAVPRPREPVVHS